MAGAAPKRIKRVRFYFRKTSSLSVQSIAVWYESHGCLERIISGSFDDPNSSILVSTASRADFSLQELPETRVYICLQIVELTSHRSQLDKLLDDASLVEDPGRFKSVYFFGHHLLARLQTFQLFLHHMKDPILQTPALLLRPINPAAARGTITKPQIPPESFSSTHERSKVLRGYQAEIEALFNKVFEIRRALDVTRLMG